MTSRLRTNHNDRRVQVRWFAVVALLAALALPATQAPPAAADHNYFDCTPSSSNPCTVLGWTASSICFYFTPSFWTASNSRQRAIDSLTNWSISATGRPSAYDCGSRPDGESQNPATCQMYSNGDNRFHRKYLGSAFLGLACAKYVSGNIAAVQINATNEVDSWCDYSGNSAQKPCWWYHDDSTSGIPSNKVDLESILTHEMGHGYGLYIHFDVGDSPCVTSNEPYIDTMCPGGPWFDPGDWYLRTVNTVGHDYTVMCSAPNYGGSC